MIFGFAPQGELESPASPLAGRLYRLSYCGSVSGNRPRLTAQPPAHNLKNNQYIIGNPLSLAIIGAPVQVPMWLLAASRHGLFPPPGYFSYLCGDFDFTIASGEGTNDEGSLTGTFQDYKSQKAMPWLNQGNRAHVCSHHGSDICSYKTRLTPCREAMAKVTNRGRNLFLSRPPRPRCMAAQKNNCGHLIPQMTAVKPLQKTCYLSFNQSQRLVFILP